MKCRACGHRFRLGPPGLGFSSAPGLFLIAGIAGGGLAYLGYRIQDVHPTLGPLLMICGGALGVGGFVLLNTAEQDATAYGPRSCPRCGAIAPVWPWSV